MSLTNPEKVVTEERLSQFYGSILPYLGGMPEAIVNKFSKSDLYSTDEKIIGQWINGKPLYQKLVDCGNAPNTATENSKWYNYGTGIDHSHLVFAFSVDPNGWVASLPYDIRSNGCVVVSNYCNPLNDHKGYIGLHTEKDRSTFHIYAVVQYTKIADSAISIGSDTDYSTTEKIIGTWVDGKSIYQKTITNITLSSSTDTVIQHGISNLDKIIDAKSFCRDANSTIFRPNPFAWANHNSYTEAKYYSGFSVTKTNIEFTAGASYISANPIVDITLQYTKTTN